MAVVNLKRKKIFAWVPPNNTTAFKFTVTRSDGTIDDITSKISKLEIKDQVTEGIGSFSFDIWDPNEEYVTAWTGNEIVHYYKDYAATASTLKFSGKIEKPSKRGNRLNVKGRSQSLLFLDITVTQNFTSVDTGTILASIISTYAPGFTSTNVVTSGTPLTVNWTQKPFWDCVKDLCSAPTNAYDCYVDGVKDFHYFESGSVKNSTDAIVHEMNLLEVNDFTPDISLVKNRIIVYGATVDGIQILDSGEDLTSQSTYGLKEKIINDDNLVNETQVSELVAYELARLKDPPNVGDVKSILLATILPGDSLQVSSPANGLSPQYYVSTGYKDVIDNVQGLWSTQVFLNKEPRKMTHLMKDRIENENSKKRATTNPNEMRFSKNFFFDDNTGTFVNTSITDSVVKTSTVGATWVSPATTTTSNINEVYLILVGTKISGVTIGVSGDGGVNYQTVANKEKVVLSSAKGSNLVIKITFDDTTAEIDSLSLQYKF